MVGSVIWITGLSGAGKSTLAHELVTDLQKDGQPVLLLDGDELRSVFAAEHVTDYDRTARLNLALQYARLCRMLARQGQIVVIATISLFREVHDWNRANQPSYLEIYLDVPLNELRRRDPKGLYRRHAEGEASNVASLDFPVDEPVAPDLHFKLGSTPQTMAREIRKMLHTRTVE